MYHAVDRFASSLLLLTGLVSVLACCARHRDDAQFADDATLVNPLAFSAVDVYGRPFTIGEPSHDVWVVFFNAMDTNDPMEQVTSDLAIRYHATEHVMYLNVFDLRSLAFYEKPFAEGTMRSRGRDTVARVNAMLEEMGLSMDGDMLDHMYVWSDGGELIDRYSVPDPNVTITCIVHAPNGLEIGRFDTADGMEPIFDAIDRSLASLGERP